MFDENVGVQQVAAGDVLCDIETDKATLDFESLEDGWAPNINLKVANNRTNLVN